MSRGHSPETAEACEKIRTADPSQTDETPAPDALLNASGPPAGVTDETAPAPEDEFGDGFSFRIWDGEACREDPSSVTGEKTSAATGEDSSSPGAPPSGLAPADDKNGASSPLPAAASPAKTKVEAEDGDPGKPMSLMEHLTELRNRLVKILVVVFLGFFACFSFAVELFDGLVKPLAAVMPAGSKLIYTALPEAFFVQMKLGFVASAFLTSPYIFYQIWAFVAPGLYEEERRFVIPLAAFSAFFFLSGAAFCYFAVFPVAFDFFMSFATDSILPMPSLGEYLDFALKLLIAFGLIFEMPLFAFFLARLGVLSAQRLRAWRRYAVIIIFIVAAILTPPDVISQLLMATPMLLLYEVSIWVAAFAHRPKAEKSAKKNRDDETPAAETGQEPA